MKRKGLTCKSYGWVVLNLVLAIVGVQVSAQELSTLGSQQPVRVSSGLTVSSTLYHIKGNEFRQQPFNWFLSGTPTLHIYGVAIPFSIYWSNQSLSYQQPFNQYGMSPSWKWIKTHIGYSNVHFSDYTLAGRRFLGGGIELNPGKFRFGAVYGKFQEAVEQDSIIRPTPGGFLAEVPNGAFARRGYSLKLGVGTERSFVDLIFFQAEDDTTSLNSMLSKEVLVPEKNTALGLKFRFGLGKRLSVDGDWGTSIYNRDQRYALLDSSGFPGLINETIQPRTSSQFLYAGNAQLVYQDRNLRTALRYRRISRDFKTMGAFYFQTDLEEYSANGSYSMFKRKLNLRGTLGIQRDNLAGGRQQTTNRVISSAVVGWQTTLRWRNDFIYTNFGIQQRNALTGLLDSNRIDQVSSSYQFQSRYQLPSTIYPQSLGGSLTYQQLAPRSRDLQLVVDTRSFQANIFYTWIVPDQRLGLTANVHSLRQSTLDIATSSDGIGLSANKSSADDKINLSSGIHWYSNRSAGATLGSTWLLNGNFNYQIQQNWSLGLQWNILQTNGSINNADASFRETMLQIQSNFNFH